MNILGLLCAHLNKLCQDVYLGLHFWVFLFIGNILNNAKLTSKQLYQLPWSSAVEESSKCSIAPSLSDFSNVCPLSGVWKEFHYDCILVHRLLILYLTGNFLFVKYLFKPFTHFFLLGCLPLSQRFWKNSISILNTSVLFVLCVVNIISHFMVYLFTFDTI